uniref:Uncharacterized protein n=1 Tax=Cucumis melo TaxID=3656 RepID=A0A9I9EG50_CUCME
MRDEIQTINFRIQEEAETFNHRQQQKERKREGEGERNKKLHIIMKLLDIKPTRKNRGSQLEPSKTRINSKNEIPRRSTINAVNGKV